MSESTAPKRLNKVATELNQSVATITDDLKGMGVEINAGPNTKVTEEHYLALVRKYQPDKLAKEQATNLKLTPNLSSSEKVIAQPIEKPIEKVSFIPEERLQINTLGKIDLSALDNKGKSTKPKPNLPKVETELPKEEPKPIVVEEVTPVVEEIKEVPIPEKEVQITDDKKVVIPSEPVGLTVVGKIDLSTTSKSGRKKSKDAEPIAEKKSDKSVTKKKTKKEEQEELVNTVSVTESDVKTKEITPKVEGVSLDTQEEIPNEIIHAKTEQLKGLTQVGSIDLAQFNRTPKPKVQDESKLKRKRKKSTAVAVDIKKIQEEEEKKRREAQAKRIAEGGSPYGNRSNTGQNQQQPNNRAGGANTGNPNAPNPNYQGNRPNGPFRPQPNRMLSGAEKKRIKNKKKERNVLRRAEMDAEAESNIIQVTEFITANELAGIMNVSVTEVISACFQLGMMVAINQRLDAEAIVLVADNFGYEIEFKEAGTDDPTLEEDDNDANLVERPPIVTIMGHVDHGKTSLLDYIRNANVVAGEAGGITQHIGAYEVELENKKKITFLDTPGHEAFTAMRARGAKVTDIVIVVIAADDTVMPQTREAISHSQAAGVPIIFAYNKIDKEGANVDRIRTQLSELGFMVEEWGGKYQSQEISAKKGLNIDLLLEKVLLESEMLNLKADLKKRAVGTIVEATMDKGKGIIANIMVQRGTLKVGDPILAGANYGKIRAIFNVRGTRIKEAGPSTPVQILGLDGTPTAGDKFYVTESESQAKEIATKRKQLIREQGMRSKKHITLEELGRRLALGNFKELNLIVKGDVDGSVEALSDTLLKQSTEEIQINIIHKGIGAISEADVLLASASDAIIIGFQVRPTASARKLAETEEIDIRLYSIIYDAINEIRSSMEGMMAPTREEKITGNIEIREVFKITKVGSVAGCYVLDGKVGRNSEIRLVRDGVVVFTGKLGSLKRFKDDVKEVVQGYECGLTIDNYNDIRVGDIVEAFEVTETARKLENVKQPK